MDSPIVKALITLLSAIPESKETAVRDPRARAQEIVNVTALKAAGISGSLSALPGPLAYVTMIPDILSIWKLQAQMVADIAHVYGKEAHLGREVMLYCLFRHGGSAMVRDIGTRLGERLLLKRTTIQVFQGILHRIGVHLSARALRRSITRWVPVLGAAGVAGYAFFDTRKVGQTAIETFSSELLLEEAEEETPLLLEDLKAARKDAVEAELVEDTGKPV
jgi:hypothetical protein